MAGKRGGIVMNGVVKGALLVLVILYIVSPVDAVPGPIDDLVVALLGLAATKALPGTE